MQGKKERTITFLPQEELKRKDKTNRTNPPSNRRNETIGEVSRKIIQDLDEEPLLKREKQKRIEEIKEEILDEEFQDVQEVEIPSSERVNIIDEEPQDIKIPREPPQPSIDNTELIKQQIEKDKLQAQKIALEQARTKDAKIRQREFLEEEERKQKARSFVSNILESPIALGELRESPTTARKKGQGRPRGQNILALQRGIEENTEEKRRLVERREQLLRENQEIINELFDEYKIDGSLFPVNIRDLNKIRNQRDYDTFRTELIRAIDTHRNRRYKTLRKQIINRIDKFNRIRKEINNLNQKIRR